MADPIASSRVQGYADFAGLAGLRADAGRQAQGSVREVARQFEAHFLQHMFKSMRATVERSDLADNPHGEAFEDLMDKELSVRMASRGALGLADMLERDVARRAQPTAHEALQARERAWPPAREPLGLPAAPGGLPLPARPGSLPLQRVKAGDE